MEETLQHFKALDVLINNAGMMHTENLQKLTGNTLIFLNKIKKDESEKQYTAS